MSGEDDAAAKQAELLKTWEQKLVTAFTNIRKLFRPEAQLTIIIRDPKEENDSIYTTEVGGLDHLQKCLDRIRTRRTKREIETANIVPDLIIKPEGIAKNG